MKLENNNGIIPEKQFEELLLNLRPDQPNEPLHPPVDDLTRRRMIGAVLADWESANQPRPTYKAQRHPALIAMAAIFLAAVLGGVYFITDSETVDPQPQTAVGRASAPNSASTGSTLPQRVPQSRFSLLQGDVNCGSMAVNLGASVPMERWIETRQGQTAFSLPTGIAVGLADNSVARVFWNGKRKYEVEINQGKALFSIDPHKSREGFGVRTPNGVINVTGTLFTVAVADQGEVNVHLHRGQVEIQTPDNPVQFVKAGQTAVLHERAIDVETTRRDLSITSPLYRLGCFDGGETFSELTVEDCDMHSERAMNDSSPRPAVAGTARQRSHRSAARTKAPTSTLTELLRYARKARQDERWNDSAAAYRKLINEYPGTANSRTALVSLADIELKQLHNPKAALAHYNAYLSAPGTLEREALYGKAKVFRLTNNVANEIKTLTKLVDKYPAGPISQAASKRLEELNQ